MGKLAGGREGMREKIETAMVNRKEQKMWRCNGRKRVDGMIKTITTVWRGGAKRIKQKIQGQRGMTREILENNHMLLREMYSVN